MLLTISADFAVSGVEDVFCMVLRAELTRRIGRSLVANMEWKSPDLFGTPLSQATVPLGERGVRRYAALFGSRLEGVLAVLIVLPLD